MRPPPAEGATFHLQKGAPCREGAPCRRGQGSPCKPLQKGLGIQFKPLAALGAPAVHDSGRNHSDSSSGLEVPLLGGPRTSLPSPRHTTQPDAAMAEAGVENSIERRVELLEQRADRLEQRGEQTEYMMSWDTWLREQWNSRRRLRRVMHPWWYKLTRWCCGASAARR